MMQQKRSPISFEQNSFMDSVPKRSKTDVPLSSKGKKEKFSERISALQQLVSPYGKVLSAPYLYSTPTAQTQDEELCLLRAKGLCLVPISFTVGVESSNGADIWAPIKTSAPNSRRSDLDEASVLSYN